MDNNSKNTIDSLFWRIAVQDDEYAFKTLFTSFFAPLCVFSRRYIDNSEICEDIVQDTFFKIWKNRKSIEITSSARNFLITNVKNSCLDYLRRKDVENSWIEKQLAQEQFSFYTDELYTTHELETMLNEALSKLLPNIRNVFEMNRFEGKTYMQIAAEQNISIKTVEAYMSKALKHLRVELKDYLPFIILFLWK